MIAQPEVTPLEKERPDLRLAPSAVAAWLCGLVLLGHGPRLAAATAAVGGAVALLAWRGRGQARLVVAAAAVAVAATAAACGLRLAALEAGPLPGLARAATTVRAEVVVTSDPRTLAARADGQDLRPAVLLVDARVERLTMRGAVLRIRAPVLLIGADPSWAGVVPSERIAVVARLRVPDPGEPLAAVLSARGPPRLLAPPSALQRAAARLRAGLRHAVSPLGPDERGLVPGLVLGDTSQVPAQLVDDFRTSGLTHLLAVSGTNLTIILAVVLGAARRSHLQGRAVPVVGAVGVLGFVVLARPQPSVLRAALMGLVALGALAGGRRRRALPALFASVVALLLVDPWLARSYGFALSVLATGAIVLLAPAWSRALVARVPRCPAALADAVAVPAAAQAVCGPVIVLLSGQVSLVAIPANMIAAPAVAPATVLGVLAAVLAPLSERFAQVPGRLAGLPAWWLVQVAERGAVLPGAAVAWPVGAAGALLLVVLTAAVLAAVPTVARAPAALAGSAAVLLLVGGVSAISPAWPPKGWVMVACDVGQGDGLVLAAGPGAGVVVDAGPDPRAVDGCLRRLGVGAVPLLLLTHMHADHVEGVPGVLHGRQVGELEIGPLDEPVAEAARVAAWARGVGLAPVRAEVGERRAVGGLTWQVLAPRRVLREGSAPNNASVVLLAEHAGVRMLLLGDEEPPAQADLLRSAGTDLTVDVLKVAHHGSAYQDPALVAAARARAAIISVGAGNDYGHPAPSTVALLRATGADVTRTDRDGDIAVVGPADRLRVVRRGARHTGRAVGAAWNARADATNRHVLARRVAGTGRAGHRAGGAARRTRRVRGSRRGTRRRSPGRRP